jgi:hypothetical protein
VWLYEQSSGRLSRGGVVFAVGYSGAGDGKNNPELQNVKDIGPIPQGLYTISEPQDSPTPFALPLTPDPVNEMFGRDDFLMHGDSIENPGAASEGCIIMPRTARQTVWASNDRLLQVIPRLADNDATWPEG